MIVYRRMLSAAVAMLSTTRPPARGAGGGSVGQEHATPAITVASNGWC